MIKISEDYTTINGEAYFNNNDFPITGINDLLHKRYLKFGCPLERRLCLSGLQDNEEFAWRYDGGMKKLTEGDFLL